MNLSHSRYLQETPDFSGVINLEQLVLEGCTSLCEVHPSLVVLNKLNFLSLKNCIMLKSLPSNIYNLKSLETFDVSGCSDCVNLKWLKELCADKGTPSASHLMPRNSAHLGNLGFLSSLKSLNLSGNHFVTLPSSINQLSQLKWLGGDPLLPPLEPASPELETSSPELLKAAFSIVIPGRRIPDWIGSIVSHFRSVTGVVVGLVQTATSIPITVLGTMLSILRLLRGGLVGVRSFVAALNEEVNGNNITMIQYISPPNSTLLLEEIHEGDSSGSGWSYDGSESENSDYYNSCDGETSESGWCSDDSESEMQPEKRLKWSSNQDNED
ncbi:Disease resistance-like protein DSC2 [Vitis vinifera]|uniref:Disease resistance-like protein DSC2 n=1 Tax=Vitis vinifera TaxID=29760 RepID=A0A438C809_VITVI|nr:Disease resistance-like protein DSC2 [Vitis vinifera]